jgi:hypothetical protein
MNAHFSGFGDRRPTKGRSNMFSRKVARVLGAGILGSVAMLTRARAADATPPGATAEDPPVPPSVPTAQKPMVFLPWDRPTGQGVAFGMEEGSWGSGFGGSRWEQGVRFRMPLGEHFGVHLRGIYLAAGTNDEFQADAGGRLDLVGGSVVFMNLMRFYGGGGLQVFYPVAGSNREKKAHFGGGGQFGFEFFSSPYFSFFLEVGGQGGEPAAGATILAGLNLFPWTR